MGPPKGWGAGLAGCTRLRTCVHMVCSGCAPGAPGRVHTAENMRARAENGLRTCVHTVCTQGLPPLSLRIA